MTKPDATLAQDLSGYEVLVAIAGGIAVYKVCTVVSRLVQRGAGVTVAMTDAATRFVGPLTFRALTARPVITSLWSEEHVDPQHLHLTEQADLVLVAPATANLLAKMALGLADDLVSTLLISVACPVVVAPAMNTRMWEHPRVRANVETLRACGVNIVGPGSGWMACRDVGVGRMSEPEEILGMVVPMLISKPPKEIRH
jgi:phosphopantothenoylcysteine synthetase/decarboxylase